MTKTKLARGVEVTFDGGEIGVVIGIYPNDKVLTWNPVNGLLYSEASTVKSRYFSSEAAEAKAERAMGESTAVFPWDMQKGIDAAFEFRRAKG